MKHLDFVPMSKLLPSIIVSKRFVDNKMEVITHNGNCYSLSDKPKLFSVTTDELATMRLGQYTPETILKNEIAQITYIFKYKF